MYVQIDPRAIIASPELCGHGRLTDWRQLQGKWNFRAKRKGDLLAEY
jgi:hypothetical protein